MPTASVSNLPAPLDWNIVAGFPWTLPITLAGGQLVASPTVTLTKISGDAVNVSPTVTLDDDVVTISLTAEQTTLLNRSTHSKAFYRWTLAALVNGDGPMPLIARDCTVWPLGSARQADPGDAEFTISIGATVELAVTMDGSGTWGTYILSETGAPFVLESGDLLVAG